MHKNLSEGHPPYNGMSKDTLTSKTSEYTIYDMFEILYASLDKFADCYQQLYELVTNSSDAQILPKLKYQLTHDMTQMLKGVVSAVQKRMKETNFRIGDTVVAAAQTSKDKLRNRIDEVLSMYKDRNPAVRETEKSHQRSLSPLHDFRKSLDALPSKGVRQPQTRTNGGESPPGPRRLQDQTGQFVHQEESRFINPTKEDHVARERASLGQNARSPPRQMPQLAIPPMSSSPRSLLFPPTPPNTKIPSSERKQLLIDSHRQQSARVEYMKVLHTPRPPTESQIPTALLSLSSIGHGILLMYSSDINIYRLDLQNRSNHLSQYLPSNLLTTSGGREIRYVYDDIKAGITVLGVLMGRQIQLDLFVNREFSTNFISAAPLTHLPSAEFWNGRKFAVQDRKLYYIDSNRLLLRKFDLVSFDASKIDFPEGLRGGSRSELVEIQPLHAHDILCLLKSGRLITFNSVSSTLLHLIDMEEPCRFDLILDVEFATFEVESSGQFCLAAGYCARSGALKLVVVNLHTQSVHAQKYVPLQLSKRNSLLTQ